MEKKWNGESWRDYRITENVCVRENEKNLRGYPNKGMVQGCLLPRPKTTRAAYGVVVRRVSFRLLP